jgi:hypothetical protein
MYKAAKIARERLASLRRGDLGLLTEAFVELTATSLKLRFAPFNRTTSAITETPISSQPRLVNFSRLRWAIRVVAGRLPLRTKCIEMAVCMHAMLRRRGVASTLHYGIRRDDMGNLSAHVWLSSEGKVLLGGETAAQFACVATFAAPVHH